MSYDEWATPLSLFEVVDDRYAFTVDACAAAWNAKVARYWSLEDSALSHDWAGERVWCNPPFSNPRPFIEKARTADLAVVLLPLWSSRSWLGYALEHCDGFEHLGRVAFEGKFGRVGVAPEWRSGLFVFARGA